MRNVSIPFVPHFHRRAEPSKPVQARTLTIDEMAQGEAEAWDEVVESRERDGGWKR